MEEPKGTKSDHLLSEEVYLFISSTMKVFELSVEWRLNTPFVALGREAAGLNRGIEN